MPTFMYWRDALLALVAYFLLLALCDPAPAAEFHGGANKERTMAAIIKQWEEIEGENPEALVQNILPSVEARIEVIKRKYGLYVSVIEIDTAEGTLRITASSDSLKLTVSRVPNP